VRLRVLIIPTCFQLMTTGTTSMMDWPEATDHSALSLCPSDEFPASIFMLHFHFLIQSSGLVLAYAPVM
jgi:hypothetical protein